MEGFLLDNLGLLITGVLLFIGSFFCWTTINQGNIGVVTMFGKYRRILTPGLNFKIPLLEVVSRTISAQNQTLELKFEAITKDQARVGFKSMVVYKVKDVEEDTIKNVAF